MNLGAAFPVAKRIVETLREKVGSKKREWAGSLRRMRENIEDSDIMATGPDRNKIIYEFTHLPEVKEVLASGSPQHDGPQRPPDVVRQNKMNRREHSA